MNMQLELALSTLVIPLLLSFLIFKIGKNSRKFEAISVFIVWLISYLWIAGVPSIPPKEAIEWVVYIGVIFAGLSTLLKSSIHQVIIHGLLLVIGIVLVAWPVLSHSPELRLFAELLFFAIIGLGISFGLKTSQPNSPALTLGISNGGLAIVAGLGGSLLIGQLAGALASALGIFALYEIFSRLKDAQIKQSTLLLAALLSLLMLVVARVYADIPLIPTVLIALSLMLGLTSKWRYATGLSLILIITSITWLLLTTDNSSYY